MYVLWVFDHENLYGCPVQHGKSFGILSERDRDIVIQLSREGVFMSHISKTLINPEILSDSSYLGPKYITLYGSSANADKFGLEYSYCY